MKGFGMNSTQIYLLIVIAALALLVYFINRRGPAKKLTPLAGLAFGFVLAGLVFGEPRLLGYSLMGIGVLLAVIDMVIKARQ